MKPIITNRENFANYFGDDITDSLVQFDSSEKCYFVTVDSRTSDFYAHWAALHEAFCCGDECSCFGTALPEKRDINRCKAVDKILMDHMNDSEKTIYAEKRIEMFQTLLDLNLNPRMNDSFRASLDYFKSLTEL